jgi:hypothetical protein
MIQGYFAVLACNQILSSCVFRQAKNPWKLATHSSRVESIAGAKAEDAD